MNLTQIEKKLGKRAAAIVRSALENKYNPGVTSIDAGYGHGAEGGYHGYGKADCKAARKLEALGLASVEHTGTHVEYRNGWSFRSFSLLVRLTEKVERNSI